MSTLLSTAATATVTVCRDSQVRLSLVADPATPAVTTLTLGDDTDGVHAELDRGDAAYLSNLLSGATYGSSHCMTCGLSVLAVDPLSAGRVLLTVSEDDATISATLSPESVDALVRSLIPAL